MSDSACGRCLCGGTRLEILGPPRWVAHCHCESCRRATGAPLTTYIGINASDLRVIRDSRRRFASSPGVLRGFCGECGSPLSYESERWPHEIHIHLSAMDHPQQFVPQAHVYFTERVAWLELNDDLPRYDTTAGRGAVPSSYGPRTTHGQQR